MIPLPYPPFHHPSLQMAVDSDAERGAWLEALGSCIRMVGEDGRVRPSVVQQAADQQADSMLRSALKRHEIDRSALPPPIPELLEDAGPAPAALAAASSDPASSSRPAAREPVHTSADAAAAPGQGQGESPAAAAI